MRAGGILSGLAVAAFAVLATPVAAANKIVTAEGAGIVRAAFADDADVYPHRIMGRIREKTALVASDAAGNSYRVDLSDQGAGHPVFEDMAPRIADVTGDGRNELVVVESDPQTGASLAIYGLRDGRLEQIGATPHIGTRFRWLAPIGIADLNGDGRTDIAYIETPHLGKVLKLWSWVDGRLQQFAQARGLTNHRIGDEFIWGGLRDCGQGPELITSDAAWKRIIATRVGPDGLVFTDLGRHRAPHGWSKAMDCR
ncbi:FG-GAP repeat domain-containing protein [Oceanomicrobium pacificus]|uniref:VCBS repeat-containing protein n=1 Tax=Oceanomicrobium pacificus TaxID=2692916 RepID=A0A6B0U3L5_9RHOB|nr:VCBS repeat-containing protein [Oceanomicrobium pacificus]MXU65541.1 VCBS repeat-containing protein [Oceanomicrobium pacificus]